MRFLSLFSGIEAASVAWKPLGWECVGVAEIEAFPCALLEQHYPDVPNLGDVTKITEEQVRALGHIDLVVGGFPCQDLSVAGKRAGFQGARSVLFFDAMRVVRWSRARWVAIENVPGIFSTHKGRDFAAVVSALAGCEFDVPVGGWRNSGVALGPDGLVEWCTLDAQFFGLAQRRKRVFFVRDSGAWADRPPVLLEPESLRGDPPPRREAGERIAPTVEARANAGGAGWGTDFLAGGGLAEVLASDELPDVAGCLQHRDAKGVDSDTKPGHLIVQAGDSRLSTEVRRLTPIECERLQGFRDRYTIVTFRRKPAKDGPRYKALGNSMATHVMRWIGERIATAVRYELERRVA